MAIDPNKTPEEIAAEEVRANAEAKAARSRAIAAIPALFIDTWGVLSFAGHIRVTFGEIYGDTDNFRTAIVLDLDDAISLGRQLVRVAERRKIRDQERATVREREDEAGES